MGNERTNAGGMHRPPLRLVYSAKGDRGARRHEPPKARRYEPGARRYELPGHGRPDAKGHGRFDAKGHGRSEARAQGRWEPRGLHRVADSAVARYEITGTKRRDGSEPPPLSRHPLTVVALFACVFSFMRFGAGMLNGETIQGDQKVALFVALACLFGIAWAAWRRRRAIARRRLHTPRLVR